MPAACTTLLDEVHAFLRAARWRVRSWSWTAAATTLLDEVHAFLRAARWRVRSWSWTAAATTLMREVHAFLRAVACAELELDCCCGYYPAG